MAILPVSSVSLNNRNRINFGDKEVSPRGHKHSHVVEYASVPVVVLMSMYPGLTTQAAEMNSPEPKQITMEMPYSPTETDSEVMYAFDAAPVSAPMQASSLEAPYGWAWLKGENVKFAHRGKTPVTEFDMLYTTSKQNPGSPKDVVNVYIILDNEYNAPKNPNARPAEAREIIYHKLNNGEEFCSLVIKGHLVDKNGEEHGWQRQEIKIDDATANMLIDLLYGDSGWNNKTGIEISQTDSPHLSSPKFY